MITKYMEYCLLCGKPKTDIHHLISGGLRTTADADELYIPVCRECHQAIHANGAAMKLSKIVGQLAYEKQKVAEGSEVDDAREQFRKRYSRSWL